MTRSQMMVADKETTKSLIAICCAKSSAYAFVVKSNPNNKTLIGSKRVRLLKVLEEAKASTGKGEP